MPNKNNRMKNKNMGYYGHNEHDDRVPFTSESTRRVSFKNYGNNRFKNYRQRGRDDKMRAALAIDDDVEMMIGNDAGNYHRGRYQGGYQMRGVYSKRRRGGARLDSPVPGRKLPESQLQWYKVTIPEGHKYERSYLLGLIQSYIKPFTLTAYGYKTQGDSICFYVDDYKTAQQILYADRKITTSDSWRLALIVRANIPQVDINDSMRALMKLAMASRYNTLNKALDLSKFHTDPVITKEDVFCPLNRTNVMTAAIQIIAESIPDLMALNLSENKLTAVDCLKILKTSTPNLKVLHIGKNNIRSMSQFDSFQGLSVEELELDGNPLCDLFRDKESYIREVQKRFQKVIKLDGTEVPRMITFNVEEEIALVPSQGSFVCDPAAANVIRPFLQQYYSLYDSDTRAPLLDAYHEDAQFSLACSHQNTATNTMAPYLQDSRNLLVVNNAEKRKRLLRRGRANILAYLTSLPKTQHDPATLTVDCSIYSPSIIMLTVTGVFREVGERKYPLRSFHRSFVIVPVGSGFCIINELLHITPATSDQVKGAFKTAETAAAPPPVAPTAPVVPPPVPAVVPAVVPVEVDIATKQQMVTTLATQSGMNLTWAEKCLSENGWDFNRAAFVFSELQKQGKIPAEAFIK
uniref:NTF2 domain-containing protein n=1 Tax=Homalodisca liturata TaxID=320908 RepID=A0A1B6IB65_9HEMI